MRPFFGYRRRYLGRLCHLVAELLKTCFKAIESTRLNFLSLP